MRFSGGCEVQGLLANTDSLPFPHMPMMPHCETSLSLSDSKDDHECERPSVQARRPSAHLCGMCSSRALLNPRDAALPDKLTLMMF